MLVGFKAMAAFFDKIGYKIHPDTLRRAVQDDRNPLVVEWDSGFAFCDPTRLLEWRQKRFGMRRRNSKAAKAA